MRTRASKKLITKAGLITAAITGVVGLSAAPASADSVDAWHSEDRATVTLNVFDEYNIYVWDRECDGNRVWAEWVNDGSTTTHTLRDPNGCETGYGRDGPQGRRITAFRVCERTKGCSSWRYGPS